MILGKFCSRGCRFCGVKKTGQPEMPVDNEEADRVAGLVKALALEYVLLTSVCRDDLSDGGAQVFARTIKAVRGINKNTKVEALIPDFRGKIDSLKCVLDARPDCLAHNLETVPRLYPQLRPQADYRRSLGVLENSKKLKLEIRTKSSIMLGLGEERDEVVAAMQELKDNNCDYLTLGQYLSPSPAHYPVKRFIAIEEFREYSEIGLGMGFKSVLSGPKVRSSYQAQKLYQCMN